MVVAAKKLALGDKLKSYLATYKQILLFSVDNVGSKQFAQIRYALRGKANMLKCKNTLARTVLRQYMESSGEDMNGLLELINGNMAFVFCADPLDEVRKIILGNRIPAPAKPGVVATCDVVIPAGPTSLEPTNTSFFQALGIATKIVKGKIEIMTDINVVTEGERVGPSESALLHKMNILPFSYGFVSTWVVDGPNVYEGRVLDITDDMLVNRITQGIAAVAAFGRATGLPNTASVPHALVDAFKRCAALSLAGFEAEGALGALIAKVNN